MKKDILAQKAFKINKELRAFLDQNSFKQNDLTLNLHYNSWNGEYSYNLLKGNSTYINFSFEELNKLKNFLNSINILE